MAEQAYNWLFTFLTDRQTDRQTNNWLFTFLIDRQTDNETDRKTTGTHFDKLSFDKIYFLNKINITYPHFKKKDFLVRVKKLGSFFCSIHCASSPSVPLKQNVCPKKSFSFSFIVKSSKASMGNEWKMQKKKIDK